MNCTVILWKLGTSIFSEKYYNFETTCWPFQTFVWHFLTHTTFVNMKTFQTIDNHCDLTIKSKHCNVYQSQTGEHNPKAKVTEDDDDTLGSWADVFSGCVMCIKQWSYPGSPYSVLYAYRVPARPPPPSQWAIKSATFSYCQGGKPFWMGCQSRS